MLQRVFLRHRAELMWREQPSKRREADSCPFSPCSRWVSPRLLAQVSQKLILDPCRPSALSWARLYNQLSHLLAAARNIWRGISGGKKLQISRMTSHIIPAWTCTPSPAGSASLSAFSVSFFSCQEYFRF